MRAILLALFAAACTAEPVYAHDLNYDQCMGLVNTVHIFFQHKTEGEKADKTVLGAIEEKYQRPGSFIQDEDDLALVEHMWDAVKKTSSPESEALGTVLYTCLKNYEEVQVKKGA